MRSWTFGLILLAGSLALTVIFWTIGLPFFLLFLFVPLIPLFSKRRKILRCPVCGWEATGNERFCPYDSTLLETVESHQG